jgi:hypothetical protein
VTVRETGFIKRVFSATYQDETHSVRWIFLTGIDSDIGLRAATKVWIQFIGKSVWCDAQCMLYEKDTCACMYVPRQPMLHAYGLSCLRWQLMLVRIMARYIVLLWTQIAMCLCL